VTSDDEWDGEPLDLSNDPTVTNDSGTYIWCVCPHEDCGKKNWVYLGRMDDVTAPDREALRCWACDKLSWLSREVREESAIDGRRLEDAFDEKGVENIS